MQNVLTSIRRRWHGFTLTELALVMGIFGMIAAGIWGALATVEEANNEKKAVVELQTISNNIKTLYASRQGFLSATQTDITCSMVDAGVFPADMMVVSTCTAGTLSSYPRSPWGSAVQVFSSTSAPDAGVGQFEIQFTATPKAMPKSSCIGLLVRLSGVSRNYGLTYLYSGGTGWVNVSNGVATVSSFGACSTGVFSSSWKLKG